MNSNELTTQISDLWARAVEHPIGLRVRTDSPGQLQELLLEARLKAKDPGMFAFTIQVKGDEVWLVRCNSLPTVKTEGEYSPLEE